MVEAFVAFLWSETAQEAFSRYYFRAVTDEELSQAVPEFHEIEQPFRGRSDPLQVRCEIFLPAIFEFFF